MALTERERRLVDAIAARRDELVALTAELVAFDTTARAPADPPREEAALQEHLADRLRAAGADVELWEPAPGDVAGSRQVPPGLGFAGRPQLLARLAGAGGGRSLLFNGHVDAVSFEPRDRWTGDPLRAEVRDGLLYGRGACDTKGGVAAMVLAAEAVAGSGERLAGDLLVNTVTDEESSGAGGIAALARGVRADGCVVTEPTAFEVWTCCRGSLTPTVIVTGRPGHAEIAQPHWREGGAVNAIEKSGVVLDAVRRLREEWAGRPDQRHPHLSPGTAVPTMITGGEWFVTYPAECRVTFEVMYLPGRADADGWGTAVEVEIEDWLARAAAADPWLREQPPAVSWALDIPPYDVSPDEPVAVTMLAAAADAGLPRRVGGLDSWFDAATFARFGGTPAIGFGPRSIEAAHTVDEHVPVDDLVVTAQALAVAALRFCGTAEG
jgi:acetylornithine deacetylase